MRVVIAGGGTGGHLFPGLAVAHELVRIRPGSIVTFAGTVQGIERRVVPREGFELDTIRSAGLKGKSVAALVRGVGVLPMSAWDAWRMVIRRRPDVVVGVGGYSSGPVVSVAALRGIPTLVLEQNAVPGLANRLLARFVDAAAVTYEESVTWFGGKAVVTGNPVRAGFRDAGAVGLLERDDMGRGARLLVFGGSQGAHAINVAMMEAAPRLAAARMDVTHQTGLADLARVRSTYQQFGLAARVEPFLDHMDREMASADLIVCRAGATTLAEVTAAGRPAILVPLPTATDDHQRRNAEALVRAGAADMLEQRFLTGATLATRIETLMSDLERRRQISRTARLLARPDAAYVIAERVLALGDSKREAGPARTQ
jgi:UDP-N-acetylglucosamine--N-acetylmuramyl-(pentapeptide) pyrophosphoryl-undecaprenol N-acetylglucosamine transferase